MNKHNSILSETSKQQPTENNNMIYSSLRGSIQMLTIALSLMVSASSFSLNKDERVISRRDFGSSSMAGFIVGTSPLWIDPSFASADETSATVLLSKYEDRNCKFAIDVPSEWTKTEQTLPDRRKIVLYFKPESNQKTLVFVAYTPTRDDYTSLGSFGSVDEVAQATILPKAELAAKQGIESEMLRAESKKQAYFFDYIQSVPSQPTTHFRTIFNLATGATGGAGNVLVTITAQTPESDYDSMKSLFDKILDSYQTM